MILEGFDWTTPFIADACVQLSLPVRVGPFGLQMQLSGQQGRRARRGRRGMPAAPTCSSKRSPRRRRAMSSSSTTAAARDEGCIGDLVVGEAFMSGLAAHDLLGNASRHRGHSRHRRPGVESRHLSEWPAGIAAALDDRAEAANLGKVTVTPEISSSRMTMASWWSRRRISTDRRDGEGHRVARGCAGRAAAQGRAVENAVRSR